MAYSPSSSQVYQTERRQRWDTVSRETLARGRRTGRFYHALLQRYYRSLVPPGLTVLELGCGHGDLLDSLRPALGVGVDFSYPMVEHARKTHPHLNFICADVHHIELKIRFDVIILSDLVNDLWDVQSVLARLASCCHAGTRVIINFFNNMWKIPMALARRYHLSVNMMEQNWLTPGDIVNLLHLTGYEFIRSETRILWPVYIPVLSRMLNRYLIHLPPMNWFGLTNFIIARPSPLQDTAARPASPLVSIIIPARNEAGNIETLLEKTVIPGHRTELIFVEGGSNDGTYKTIQRAIGDCPGQKNCRLIRQTGKGKGDAVRAGFQEAKGDLLMILDADLTVPPETLALFVAALTSGKGEFINGVRLVYPMESQSMRFLNMAANKMFSFLFSWLIGQPVKDTLCGTKALWKKDYDIMSKEPDGFSALDPFGDFDLLINAARLNLKIVDLPVRYRRRRYGTSNIKRVAHGWLLLKMIVHATRRLKFI